MAPTRSARRLATTVALMMVLAAVLTGPAVGKPGPAPSTSCTTPATDLCTDHVFRGRRWAGGTVTYYLNAAGAPPGAEQDVRDAFAAWELEQKSPAVEAAFPGDGSSIRFVYGGLTTSTPGRDGRNVVAFTSTSGTAAVTLATKGNAIVEFDLVFNRTFGWSTDLTCPTHDCGTVDLQNVTTHEVGHVLDLYHVTAEGDSLLTMYPYPADPARRPGDWRNETVKRDLGAGEVVALRKAYPV